MQGSAMEYHIGQQLPAAASLGYFGRECQPRWNCVITRPGSAAHIDCRAFVRDQNMFAFYPSHEVTPKARRGRRMEPREVPLDGFAGYVFAQFLREPQWHLWGQHKWFIDVFKVGENPYDFRYVQIRHLQGMTVDAERLLRAQEQMRADIEAASRPVAGQPAVFVEGPFAGQTVHIAGVVGATAILELMGMKVTATTKSLRRIA